MRALIQRVTRARVLVGAATVGEIGPGLLLLFCAMRGDGKQEAEKLLNRTLKLRLFADEAGKMNRNLSEHGGGLLVVSQFTLAADLSSGNRPGFSDAAAPDLARKLYDHFVQQAQARHPIVQAGQFGADMQIELVNDGPVTIPLQISESQ